MQRGLQLNVELAGDKAVFYRVLQDGNLSQTALVMLNKGDTAVDVSVSQFMQAGTWVNALTAEEKHIQGNGNLSTKLAPHSVGVWILDGSIEGEELLARLTLLMNNK